MSQYNAKIQATIEVLRKAIEIARNLEKLWQALINGGYDDSLKTEVEELKSFQQCCQELINYWKSQLAPINDNGQENSILHKKYYVQPILEAIEVCRGQAELEQVSDYVYKKLEPMFSSAEFELLDYRIRWQNQMEWTGHILRKAQLMKSDSPKGVWEISFWGRLVLRLIKEWKAKQLSQNNLHFKSTSDWEQGLWELILQAEKSHYLLIWEYIIPILRVLKMAGGKASIRDTLAGVQNQLQSHFQPKDWEADNGRPNWEKSAMRLLQLMERAGLIAKIDPFNWQLTQAGEQYYASFASGTSL